ncbi:beta strand repeat-containing protein [Methylomicrobium album]|uniref:Uncharacterized protein n=1 Tax=Methylomicrobium album BG8 TaxID=686340 RepID=H8GFV3_METAL|nr:hypothetical protein [Methylomicrobium album]EIC28704.1 hypothetical protein Metal_0880 [Methylomicrobium album BG8]
MAISSTEKAQLILDALHARDFILKPKQEANLIKQIEKLYAKGKTDDFIANKIAHKPFIKAQLNKLLKTDPTFKASIDTDHNGKISVAEKKAMFAGVTAELVNKIVDAVESQVTLTQDKTQITEGLDSVTYTLTGKAGTTLTWSVDSAHTDDVVAASGTVTLNASGTGTFSVTAKQDSLVEGAELASVTVKDVTGAVKATGQVTINDPAPSQVTLTQDQTEITEGQAPVNYTVTGVAGSTLTWSVDSAHAGDVLVASGAVTLNALGVGTFSITAKSDSLAEGPELATVTLKDSNGDVQATGQLTINDPPQTDLIPAEIFTLKEVIVPGTDPTPAQYQIYWGYNPHDHQGGWNQGNEAPSDGGIPVADLVNFLKTITGLDLQELGLIDADGQDPFQNVTSLSLSNPITASGSNPSNSGNGGNGGDGGNGGNGGLSGGGDGGEGGSSGGIDQSTYLRIDYADGTYLNAEVALGDAYFSFLSSLLFDNEGNSRLYEKVIEGTGSSGTEEHLAPILLTTQNNNGGTIETNVVTSPNDDLIVAGRLELLHQAYIDGGAGYNKLEVDAKGTYAQPAALLNIQEIRVNDLPNFYTTEYGSGEGNLDNTLYSNSGFLSPTGTGSDDSWLDLNRAIDLQKLVVTDGGYSGSGSYDGYSGNLTIVGVRNAATLRLEGSFKSGDTTIQYGLGQTGTLNIELALGEVTAPINILQNAPVLNIDSQGVENYMKTFFVGNSEGGSISRMYIKGTGVFGVDGDLHDSFYQGRPAIIDAHLNTGGLDITLNDHGNDVTVLGTSNNDEIEVSGAYGIVTIDAGEGRNKIVAQNNQEVDITTGAGRDDIDASGSEVVTIDAGGGQNLIYANNSQEVTIEAGDGLNTIVVDQDINGDYYGISDVSITTGGGNDNIEALRNGSVTIDAGNGNNTIVLSALQEVDITTGSGNDKVTVSGLNTTFDYGDLEEGGNGNNAGGFNGGNTDNSMLNAHFADNLAPGVVLNVDLGAGQNTLTLGRDVQIGNSTVQFGVTALEGSSISGTGIKLFVENNSDLTQADLSGATITSVVLKQELRITSDQFAAIGADKFSVQYDEEGATEDLYIVVSHDTTLSDLVNLGALNPNVRLHFELRDGATLTLSAEELHDYVAVNGIYEDSGLSGKVVITDAAFNFNPFLSGPDYGVITGGTLAAGANGWENGQVTIIREADGFDRPVPTGYEDIYTIDSDTTPLVAANIVTEAQTLKIVGDANIKFTGVVDLGGELNIAGEDDTVYQHKGGQQTDDDNDPSNTPPTGESDNFVVDFSGLHGTLTGLTLDSFQDVKEIKGNGTGTRIDVILNADVGVLNAGLKTSGVAQYVVTQIDVDQDGKDDANSTLWFNLSDASQDVEVLGLNGNAGNTIVFTKVPWGLVHPSILLEGDGYADWNGGLKADGNPNASDIGTVRVEYFTAGAPAVVNINNGGVELGVTSTGGERYFDVDGIQLVNAASLNLNVTEGDAVIDSIVDASATAQLKTLTVTATEDVTVNENLPAGLTAIDAAGVDGAFAVSVNRSGLDDQDFSFTGSAGGSTLTFTGDFTADDGSTDATTTAIDGGVGGVELVLKGTGVEVDLSDAALTHVTGVTLGQGTELSLTLDQADAIGAGNFALALGATSADLHLTGLAEQPFALSNYADGIDVSLVELADLPVITLNPATDLTGIGALRVHEGTVLNMTAAQFQQLNGNGTIWGVGNTKNFTVNITDLTQADIDPLDLNGDGDYNDAGEHNGLNLEQISANHVTVTLAENVELSATDSLATDVIGWPWFGSKTLDNTTVEIGGYTLTLADVEQANGLTVNGDAGGILSIIDTDYSTSTGIDASGFNVPELQFQAQLAAQHNVDLLFRGLPPSVVKVINNDYGFIEGVNQTVVLTEGTTVPGWTVFNIPTDHTGTEIQNFTLNLQGGTEIDGNLRLSATAVDDDSHLIRTWLKTITINSTGTAENLISGKTANIIDGQLTSQGMGPQGSGSYAYTSIANNLLNVTINGDQDLEIKGGIVFESVTNADSNDDGITANDNHEAIATLTVNSSADTYIGGINTEDDDVDGLNVVNNGTGVLTVKINGNDIDQVANNNDALSFTGTGDIHLIIDPTVDLSDDDLSAVTQITIEDDGTLILTQAQVDAIGIGNLLDDGEDTLDGATLNIVEFGSDPFDATALDPGIDLKTITIKAGDITLDPSTNLTGVDKIIVKEGSTLTLSVEQFQQLKDAGAIEGVDADGLPSEDYTVNLTGLTQADIANDLNGDGDSNDAGELLSLAGITSENITLTLAEDVALAADTNLGDLDNLTVILADNQTIGLASNVQADGLNVDGGANTTIVYQFVALVPFPGQIDASGYDVTTLKALAQSFTTGGPSNVEYSIDDLPSSVELRLYVDPADLGFLDPTFRRVVIEEGITTPSGLIFNDWDDTDEVRTLDLTLNGDVTLNGNLSIPTRTDKDGDYGVQQFFQRLTINSNGAEPNTIDGNINTATVLGAPNTSDNNLLLVDINAAQELVIDGDIVFNSIDVPDDDAAALLTIDGTADVTVQQLIATDPDIDTLTVANDGTGTLTVTGASPAIDGGTTLEELLFTGPGDVVLGDLDSSSSETGIAGSALSLIDASGSTGDLNLGEINEVDSADFTLIAGTGVMIARLSDDTLDSTGVDTTPGTVDDTAGWNIDYSNAAPGSEFHLGGGSGPLAFVDGSKLDIDMGANGVLYIDETMDLSDLDLSITQTLPIVLADGVTLTLTAAQADGLTIIDGDDTGVPGFTGVVNIVDLTNDTNPDDPSDAFDLSGIDEDVAGTITFAAGVNDVTLDKATDLGFFSVTLDTLTDENGSLNGQTIRFQNVDQAERVVIAANDATPGTGNSTNVVWLFDDITAPVDTRGYFSNGPLDSQNPYPTTYTIGRLWLSNELIDTEGGDVEDLFTTLPDAVLRVDFGDISELNILLNSNAINRTIEFTNFVTVGDLEFSDMGINPVEHIESLTMKLGGQVTIGDVVIDDIIGAPGYDPNSVSFDSLTIESHRALSDAHILASEEYVNDNDGTDESGETAQPGDINTVGDINVGFDNNVDLLDIRIRTLAQSTVGDGSDGDGAALIIDGTITYDASAPGSVALLDVEGDNDVTITSVNTADADITSITTDVTGFTATLSAPGASPAFNLDNTESWYIKGGTLADTITIIPDLVDDADESLTITVLLNGVQSDVVVDLSGIDATDEAAIAVEVQNALNAFFSGDAIATADGGVVSVVTVAGNSYQTLNVASSGTQDELDATFDDGTTIQLGSAAPLNAGVVGNELSRIDASSYAGDLHLGIVADIDGSDDLEGDINGDGDEVDLNEPANIAFTFVAGFGLTTMTLGTANGRTPQLEAGNTWSFTYTGAGEGSSLTITEDVDFQPTVDPLNPTTLTLVDVPVVIDGEVDLTQITLGFNSGTTVFVPEGNTLILTIQQALDLTADGVHIFGDGTTEIVGDGTDLDLDTNAFRSNLDTVNIDISGVTLDTDGVPPADDADGFFIINVGSAVDDEGDSVGHNVTGSANDDVIDGGVQDDTLTGGAGDDSLIGGGGADTFIVDAGTDSIDNLAGDADPDPLSIDDDVLIVEAGAIANANVSTSFVATADTVNNGTANLSRGTATANGTIDVSAAGGSNGFNLTGSSDAALSIDTLIGSEQDDVINGGNLTQTDANAIDILTGNGGSDTFQFNVNIGNTTTFNIVATQANLDRETLTINTADNADTDNEILRVNYTINGAALFVNVNLSAVNVMNTDAIAAAIAAELQLNGSFIASASAVGSVITATAAGGRDLDALAIDLGNSSNVGTIAGVHANGTDVAQITTVTATGNPTVGDTYTALASLNAGGSIPGVYTPGVATPEAVVDGIGGDFNLNAGVMTVVADDIDGDTTITFTDENANNGGFTLDIDTTAAFGGSGASEAGAANYLTADIITDFLSAEDTIEFVTASDTDLQNGSGGNYLEAAEVDTYLTAFNDANAAFSSNVGTLQYYLTSAADLDGGVGTGQVEGQEGAGLLFFDANLDGSADGVILLVGVDNNSFSALDIIAS